MRRGQLSLSAVEATIGIVLVLSAAAGFTLVTGGTAATEAQLNQHAADTADVLDDEPAAGSPGTRLAAAARSRAALERERAALRARATELLPASVAFRVHTPHGTVGYPRPSAATVGTATVPTVEGPVTVEVWYV